MITASLTVCQSQASSPATSETVRPPPTWTVAHLAALVVSRQFFAAMRWSSSTQLFLGARRTATAHAVLLPRQRHGGAEDGQVDIVHDRAFFDLGPCGAGRTSDHSWYLLDHQLDVGPVALIAQDADVFQAHQRLKDLTRVDKDEGASCFLAHTSSLKRLRQILGDLRQSRLPAKIRRAALLNS